MRILHFNQLENDGAAHSINEREDPEMSDEETFVSLEQKIVHVEEEEEVITVYFDDCGLYLTMTPAEVQMIIDRQKL